MRFEKDGIVYYGQLAEVMSKTPDHELYYYSILDKIVDQLYALMTDQNMSKSDVASKLHISRDEVSRMLCGDIDLKLSTIAMYVYTLGGEISFEINHKNKE